MQTHLYASDEDSEKNPTDSAANRDGSRDSSRTTVNLDDMVSEDVSEATGVDGPPDDPSSGGSRDGSDTGADTYECLTCGSSSPTYRPRCGNCGGRSFKHSTDRTEANEQGRSRFATRAAEVTAKFNPYVPR